MNLPSKNRQKRSWSAAISSSFVLRLILGTLLLNTALNLGAQKQTNLPLGLRVSGLEVDSRSGGWLVGTPLPVLSWQIEGANGTTQKAFQLRVTDRPLAKNWYTTKVQQGNRQQFVYNGPSLAPDKTYYWQIKVWAGSGAQSEWSALDSFHTGLFTRADWRGANWIGMEQMKPEQRILPGDTARKEKPFGTDNDQLPIFRKAFSTVVKRTGAQQKHLRSAMLYIAGLGQFEATLNGQKIGDHFLDPGWTNYQKEALYVGFDVTDRIQAGENVIGVELGNGFYYIPNIVGRYKKLLVQYGYPKMICRLSLDYSDGSHQDIVSDKSWQTAPSAITFSGIYGGEQENGLLQQKGWNRPGFEAKFLSSARRQTLSWKPAIFVTDTPKALHAQQIDPVRMMETFLPVAVFQSGKNAHTKERLVPNEGRAWVYDMGQNCSGIPALLVNGKKGDTVRLIPAELLTADSLANQKATGSPYFLEYILAEDGPQNWQPKFTYYGLRYVQVKGAVPKGKPNPGHLPVIEQLKTLHVRTSAPVAGAFSCSNELFNKTYELIRWGMKSNMMSVFTDCPHREKLGWLEQVHLMGSSVRYNWQIDHMLRKTVQDMRLSQTASGLVPEIAPEFTVFSSGGNDMFRDSPEWGSSAIIVPWYLYQWYGDSSTLHKSYDMMTRYVHYLEGKAKADILYQGLGDWYDLGPDHPGVSQLTPQGLTATAIYYYDLQILDKITRLLNKPSDQKKFRALASRVKSAFNNNFLHQTVDSTGEKQVYYGTGSQTADAMALYMNLVPDSLHDEVVEHLVQEIKRNHYALTAGDIGYRYLLRVLEQEGYSDVIFKMNNRSDVPGYGYQLSKGATALTESWQALTGVSNNHFMLGHLMEWFYSGILGIRGAPEDIGCRNMIIHPEIVGDLTWAKGYYTTPNGALNVDWKKQPDGLILKIHVPVGVQANVELPLKNMAQSQTRITQNDESLNYATLRIKGELRTSIAVGAGDYQFVLREAKK